MIGSSSRIVIAGAGLAAVSAAERLRERGHTGQIVIVGDEPHRPYNRTPLSKHHVTGHADLTLTSHTPLQVTWHLGNPAVGLDVDRQHLTLHDGTTVTYDGLIIATGVTARHLPGTPLHSDRVWTLRTVDDAEAIAVRMRGARTVAIVGGGFIGCELASTARQLALDVTIVDISPTLLTRALGPAVGSAIAERHRAAGVTLHLGVGVAGWDESKRGVHLHLSDGETVTADIAVVGVGTAATIGWLATTGWDLSDGVLCAPSTHVLDRAGRAIDNIVAAGDIARWPNHRFDTTPRRVEHWINAIEMGRAAADALRDGPPATAPFTPTPRFWSHQHGIRIQSTGMPGLGTDITLLAGDLSHRRFVVGYTRPNAHYTPVLMGAVAVDSPRTLMHYHHLVGAALQ